MDVLPDPLRFVGLQPPYYGMPALEDTSIPAALQGMDVRRSQRKRATSREQELLAIYALLNAGAPVYRIPVELLAEIFMLIQSGDNPLLWLSVLGVCRHWFAIGSTTDVVAAPHGRVEDQLTVHRSRPFRNKGARRCP